MEERLNTVIRKALSAVGEGVCILDSRGFFAFVNNPFCEIYGYGEADVMGKDWGLLWDDPAEGVGILEGLTSGVEERWEGDFSHRDKGGVTVAVSLTVTLERGGDPFFIALCRLRTGPDRLETALDRLSRRDELTCLPDRPRFDEVLEEEWRRGQRQHLPLTIVIIGIDHFTAFSEEQGSRAGNSLLRSLAAEISGHVRRSGDLTARYGSDEFAIILPGMDRESAARFAESLRKGVEALKIPRPSPSPGEIVTVSLGVASAVPERGASPDILSSLAGEALDGARRGGRNRVSISGGKI